MATRVKAGTVDAAKSAGGGPARKRSGCDGYGSVQESD